MSGTPYLFYAFVAVAGILAVAAQGQKPPTCFQKTQQRLKTQQPAQRLFKAKFSQCKGEGECMIRLGGGTLLKYFEVIPGMKSGLVYPSNIESKFQVAYTQ